MSIEQQQQDEEARREREEIEASQRQQDYLDYHHQRGTSTWRAWPFTNSMRDTAPDGRFLTSHLANIPKDEK